MNAQTNSPSLRRHSVATGTESQKHRDEWRALRGGSQDGLDSPESGVSTESRVDPVDLEQLAEWQEEQLIPLKEDLADWISKIFDIEISASSFMSVLDTGVHVCKLARLVHEKASQWRMENRTDDKIPKKAPKCRENAKSGSWFARDNTANFLSWCREYQIRDDILFETEGLVLQRKPRSVVLCLLEIARIGARYGLDPLPSLITLEREIEQEELEMSLEFSQENWFPNADDSVFEDITTMSMERSVESIDEAIADVTDSPDDVTDSTDDVTDSADDVISTIIQRNTYLDSAISDDAISEATSDLDSVGDAIDDITSSCTSDEHTSLPVTPVSKVKPVLQAKRKQNSQKSNYKTPVKKIVPKKLPSTPLNEKVMKMAKTCKCFPNCYEVEQLSEGRYSIGGRAVFIRLLKDKHVMVRVGGGWDTLEHYLKKHDPCRVFQVVNGQCKRIASAKVESMQLKMDSSKRRPNSANPGFLVFSSRYKSN